MIRATTLTFGPMPKLSNILKFVSAMHQTRAQRRSLSRLDSHALCDIGLSIGDVDQEISKPIWDVPSRWTC
ncbi:MAG: DUF1127 domain-containing protein [Planktomarina sp.]